MTYEKTSLYSFAIKHFCDGDTVVGYLTCGCCGGVREARIRIPSIESWEIHSPEKARAIETGRLLTDHYRGRSGVLSARKLRRDRYGRYITDIFLEGESLALQLVTQGFAWWGVGEPDPGNTRSAASTPAGHS